MARRDKLIAKMRSSPGNIRFQEVVSLLKYEGFVLFKQRGSHCTYHRADGRVLTIVEPHGGTQDVPSLGYSQTIGSIGT